MSLARETAMRVVKAAAVQLSPVLYSREGTVERIVRTIHELGQQRVQFATFPETVIPYYPYFSFVQSPLQNIVGAEQRKLLDQAVTVPSAATDALGAAARQAGVVVSIGINERDGGTVYNAQLLFDADGTLIQRRRKISPTYHERLIWGQGDGSGLRAVDSHVGRIGQLACWEHYNPLARYAMMADGEQIHSAMYPGSIFGDLFSEQTQVNIRQHALESGCFVVCATAWLNPDQQAQIMKDTGCTIGPISGGCFTAIVAPDGSLMGDPIRSGEGVVIADLDFTLIDKRKQLSAGEWTGQDFVVVFRRDTSPMNRCNDGAVWERDLSFFNGLDRNVVAELSAQLVGLALDQEVIHGDQFPIAIPGGNSDSVDRGGLSIALFRCGRHVGDYTAQCYNYNRQDNTSSHTAPRSSIC